MSARRRLRLDPTACEGHGLCAELLPERISLDEWGYPVVDPEPLTPRLEKEAKRAVAACPRLALALRDAEPAGEWSDTRGRPKRPGG
jgi:ferredoxin